MSHRGNLYHSLFIPYNSRDGDNADLRVDLTTYRNRLGVEICLHDEETDEIAIKWFTEYSELLKFKEAIDLGLKYLSPKQKII